MSDDEAFLNAIREQPEDTVRRLVYADWLQERGDERHEMIRVETRMREIPIWSDEFQHLKPERKRLREKLPHEWLATMDYLPKHRPMFGTIPPTYEERWRLAEEFIDIWHGGLKPGDGYSEEELQQAEKRLECRLPHALREWYKRAGKREELWDDFLCPFVPVNELVWNEGRLVIRRMALNDYQLYALRHELHTEDCTLYSDCDLGGSVFLDISSTTSAMILETLLTEGGLGAGEIHGQYSHDDEAEGGAASTVLSEHYSMVELPGRLHTQIWEGIDAIIFAGRFSVRTEAAYHKLLALIPTLIRDSD